jgi:hypothetical protein
MSADNTVKQDTFEKKRNNSTNLIKALRNNDKKTQILHFIYKNMALLFFLYDGADNNKDVYMIKKKEFINNEENEDNIEYDEKIVNTDNINKNTKNETTKQNKINVKDQTNKWFNTINTEILTKENKKMSIFIYLDFLNMCREICDNSIKKYKTIFHKLYENYLKNKTTEIVEQITCFFEGILILNRYIQNPFYLNHFNLFETNKYFYEQNLTSNQVNKRFIEDKDKKIMKSVLNKQYDYIDDKNLFNNINSYILYFFVKDESSGKSIAQILYEILNNETKTENESKLWTVVNDFMCKNKNAIVLLSVDPVNICNNESTSETKTGPEITTETTYYSLLFSNKTTTSTITTSSTPTMNKIKEEEDNLESVLEGNYKLANRQNETNGADDSLKIESLINDDFTDFIKSLNIMYIKYENQITVEQFLYALALEKPFWFINYLLTCIFIYKKDKCNEYEDESKNNICHYIVASSLKQEEKMDLIDKISNGSNDSSLKKILQNQIKELTSEQGQIVNEQYEQYKKFELSLKSAKSGGDGKGDGKGNKIEVVPNILQIIKDAADANLLPPPPPSNTNSNKSNESFNASNENFQPPPPPSNTNSNKSNESFNASNENFQPPPPPSNKEELEKKKIKKQIEKQIKKQIKKIEELEKQIKEKIEELEKEELKKKIEELEKQIKEKKEELEKEELKKKKSELTIQKWRNDDNDDSDDSFSSSDNESESDNLGGGSRRETIGSSWTYKQSGGGSYDKMFKENNDGNTPFMILMENGINTEKEKNFIIKIIKDKDIIQLDQENINGHNMYDILNDNIISLIDENYNINTDNIEIKELVDSFAELCQQNTE